MNTKTIKTLTALHTGRTSFSDLAESVLETLEDADLIHRPHMFAAYHLTVRALRAIYGA